MYHIFLLFFFYVELEELEKKRLEALEHAGDAEVRDAMLEAAAYLADIGDKVYTYICRTHIWYDLYKEMGHI